MDEKFSFLEVPLN